MAAMKNIRERLNFLNLPIVLFVLWMLLQADWSVGQIILGLFLSTVISIAAWPFRPVRATLKHPFIALRLVWHVAVYIVKSNYDVGLIVCLGTSDQHTAGFLDIPLKMRDPHELAALECIITYTRVTVWAVYVEEISLLTLHILDLKDEAV